MKKQLGFGLVGILVIAAALILVGVIGWLVWRRSAPQPPQSTPTSNTAQSTIANATNTQVKNDLSIAASNLLVYVSDHNGQYPKTESQIADFIENYLKTNAKLVSPLTKKSYSMSVTSDYAKGVISLQAGTCNA